MKVEIDNVSDTITKTATVSGNSAHVIVPKTWAGKKVKVSLIEEIPDECLELAKSIKKSLEEIEKGEVVKGDVDFFAKRYGL